MKKRMFVTMFAAAWAVSATVVAVAQQSPQSGSNRKEVITQQRQAELASKYDLTQTQIDRFEELLHQCSARYAEINSMQLPNKERGQKIGETKRAFRAQVKDVMTSEQYERWLADQTKQDEALARLRDERVAKLKQIEASDVPESQKADERKAMENNYQAAVKAVLGEEKGSSAIDQQRTTGEWFRNNNKGLQLTRAEAAQLATLDKDRDSKIAELEAKDLPKPAKRSALEAIKSEYNAQASRALGGQKYAVWANNNSTRLDRELAKKYGMNPNQINSYKALLSEQQVNKMKLHESTMAPDEKMAKNNEIDKQFTDGLQQILSPKQYSKIIQNENYRKQKIQQRRQKLGSMPALNVEQ